MNHFQESDEYLRRATWPERISVLTIFALFHLAVGSVFSLALMFMWWLFFVPFGYPGMYFTTGFMFWSFWCAHKLVSEPHDG